MGSGYRTAAAAGLAALLVVGCRTVWVHPDATAEKYANDLFFCRYGMERSDWRPEPEADAPTTDSERARALTGAKEEVPGRMRRGWKQCMLRLGWTSTTGGRGEEPWRTPIPPRRYGKR